VSRFAIVGPIHPLRGGIAQHTLGIVGEARARGHRVDVISYRRLYPRVLFPGRSQIESGPPPPEVGTGVCAPLDSVAPWSWRRAAAAVAAREPEVVLLQRWHPFFAPPLAVIARRLRGRARIVWMVHNARPHEDALGWGPLLRLGYDREDFCLVHAADQVAILRGLGVPGEIRHLAMPAPPVVRRVPPAQARRRLGIAPEEVVFLFFGYVQPYKGVPVLLDALARLSPGGTRWRAIIAGEWYVDRARADAQVARLGLGDRVRIDDRFVSPERIDEYFAAATAVVLPYLSGTQSAVVPLAYAYGRPVVTTRVGGLPEAVVEGQTGRLVAPGDAAALAGVLEEIRRGRSFSAAALARAHAAASFAPLVDALEAIVRRPVFL